MRCAWHPKYHGFPWIYSVGSWRGRGVAFSDGMCRGCARRWRDEFRAGRPFAPSPAPLVPAWMPRLGVALALTSAVLLAARPLDPGLSARTGPATSASETLVASTPPSASPATIGSDCPPPTRTRCAIVRSGPMRAGGGGGVRAAIRRVSSTARVAATTLDAATVPRPLGSIQAP